MTTVDSLKKILKKYKGTAAFLQTIFDDHYDAILREIEQELQENPDKNDIMDLFYQLMEDTWPIDQEELTTYLEN